jgi:hypothetical protein
MRSIKLTPLALSLALVAGCANSPSGINAKKVADAIGTIQPSRKDTCETQRQVAEQTSKIETIRQGKEVVYASPKCEAKG